MTNPLLSLAARVAELMPMPARRAVYRIGPLARLIRSGLNRAAPQGLTVTKIAAGGLAGYCLSLDLQEEKDYWLGTYEPELQSAVAKLVKPGMIIYDVGANIGYISLLLARACSPGGRVYSFEALPANVERLKHNLDLNRMDGCVQVVAAAVIESDHPVRFLVGPSDDTGKAEGSAGRQGMAYAGTLEVAGLCLDTFVYQQGNPVPQVIKMDIEGGEVLALPGMRHLLDDGRPVLLLELHGPQAAAAAWQVLTAARYRICRLGRENLPVSSLDELDWKAYLAAFPLDSEAG